MLTASSRASARVPADARMRPSSAPAARQDDAFGQHLREQPRPAPSAVRIAISFCRDAVRASSRFERFAQTMSITIATAPASTQTRQAHAAADLFGQRLDVALEAVAFRDARR